MTNASDLKAAIPPAGMVKKERNVLGWALIIGSSILLGIWAVRETIALRNALLVLGAIASLIYCVRFFKNNPTKIPLQNKVPFILLGLMFCWVVIHYVFFSRFPEQQFHELISTWLRSFLAVIVALGTGLALAKRPAAINCLWLGILASFGYLFYQYIPKAMAAHSLFAIDYENYIYRLKISGVLSGTIMLIGLLGTLLDTLRRATLPEKAMVALLWLAGTAISLYASVFIFDARNGVGLAAMIFGIVGIPLLYKLLSALFTKAHKQGALAMLVVVVCAMMFLAWFGLEQNKHNPGWSSTWEDAKTAVQIHKYPNWQNPPALGYPQNASGQIVKGNTYERFAWATAGFTIFLPQNPLGVGILRKSFATLLKDSYPNSADISGTHSAWVDIALAFGYPGLLLLIGSLLSTISLSMGSTSPLRSTAGLLSVGLILIYMVGEVSSQHGIEILCFLISLNAALLLPSKPPITPTLAALPPSAGNR